MLKHNLLANAIQRLLQFGCHAEKNLVAADAANFYAYD